MRLTIFIKDQKIDLFKDEVIELNSSIANTDDITSINSDYSKTFTVPASENNNQIFKHYYQADIDNTFDSRIKTDGHIEFDGVLFRLGGFRLEKVSVKDNKPDAYTISFSGKLPNIKARIGNDLISDLDLSFLNFPFTYDLFLIGFSLPGRDVIFNLFETQKQYVYNPATNENDAKLVNIAYNGNARGIDWTSKRPAVRLIKLIEAIEVKYNLQFSRQFFDRVDFTELYMLCLKDSSEISSSGGAEVVNRLSFINLGEYIKYQIRRQFYPGTNNFRVKIFLDVYPNASFLSVPYVVKIYEINYDTGIETLHSVNQALGVFNFFKEYSTNVSGQILNLGNRFEIITNQLFIFQVYLQKDNILCVDGNCNTIAIFPYNTGQVTASNLFDVSKNLPKLKVTDFLKAIFKMFKLVAIPLEDQNIYVNNIDEFYKEGKLIDITKYIDFKSYDVQRGTVNNEINFLYEEPTTLLAKKFLKNTGIAYSDELFELADEFGQPLEGNNLEVKLPFEQPFYERISGTNIQYALLVDEKLESVNVKPIIFYNNNISLGGTVLSVMDAGLSYKYIANVNTPSQVLNLDVPINSLNWGVEFSTWNYAAINKTLFSEYWRNYILSVFNIKKREFKFSAILPTHVLLSLKLNDILFIRERYYKINDFSVNLNTREATLNLINTFDANFGMFSTTNKEFITDSTAQILKAYVSNSNVINLSVRDLGVGGTSWITAVKNGTFIDITLTENTSGSFREVFINANNGLGQQFEIYVRQN